MSKLLGGAWIFRISVVSEGGGRRDAAARVSLTTPGPALGFPPAAAVAQ